MIFLSIAISLDLISASPGTSRSANLGVQVATSGEFDLRLRTNGGVKTQLTVCSKGPVFSYDVNGLLFCGAIPWRFRPKPNSSVIDAFLLTYSYGSGSDKVLRIIGPLKGGKWGLLLDVNLTEGRFVQPEFIDFDGWGSCDILITVPPSASHRFLKASPNGTFEANLVQDWEWSNKWHKYVLAATVPYSERFHARKQRLHT